MANIEYAIGLVGPEQDLDSWTKLFAPPFEPSVSKLEFNERLHNVLRISEFNQCKSVNECHERGMEVIRMLNGIVAGQIGFSEVSIGPVFEIEGDRIKSNVVINLEPARLEVKVGLATIVEYDKAGNKITKAKPSFAQRRYDAAVSKQLLSDAWDYCRANPDWYDLYKAYECVRASALIKVDKQQEKLFRHTANTMYRHRKGGDEPPAKPMSLQEARAFVRGLLNEASDKVVPDKQ